MHKKANESYETLQKVTRNAPDWMRWIAQDKSGTWWGYSVEPLQNFSGWYENEVGVCAMLLETEVEAKDWKNSLQKIDLKLMPC